MKIIKTEIDGIIIIEPQLFSDNRGIFCETFSVSKYREAGIYCDFVQDNFSVSKKNIIRGLHYQIPPVAQAKLVSVIDGEIYDVAVDIRKNSRSFGKYFGAILKAPFRRQIFIPSGFAHGFSVLSERALVYYKCSAPYSPQHERGIRWNDPDLAIDWKILSPILNERDSSFPKLNQQKDIFT